MDTIRKAHIRKNLDKLLEYTRCTEGFLSFFVAHGIFGSEDVAIINAKATRWGKSREFYEILQTKKYSYEVLLEALKKSTQTGALEILESLATINPNHEPLKTPRFSQKPSYLIKFLDHPRRTLLVVITKNCSITCERITDTSQQCQEHSIEDFNRMVFSSELLSNECTVIVNCGDGPLPQLSFERLQLRKLVCVTSMNEEQITQELKSKLLASKFFLVVHDEIKWQELSQNIKEKISTDIQHISNFNGINLFNVLPDLDSFSIFGFLQGRFPPVFNNTLQEDSTYYIPRRLQSRKILSEKIFTTNAPDIYVFKNIEWYLLKEKTKKKFTQMSAKLLYQGTDKVCHYIILENDGHFEQLQYKFKDFPIHLISYEDENFIWEKSYRSIKTIQHVIESQNLNQSVIPENNVVNEVLLKTRNSKYPILISDTPGMGKSFLPENIGRELKNQINQGLVAFIVISELIRDVDQRLKTIRGPPLQTKTEIWTQALIERLSGSCLGVHYLKMRPEHLKELLLDGIDEIPKKYIPDFFDFMIAIQLMFPNTRLWITTRPHMFIELEQRFCVLGYNIKAFEEADQINFLVQYWTQTTPQIQYTDRICQFAKTCLDTVKSRLSKDEEDIAGIPLQCRLIGEVFEQNAKEFILSGHDNNPAELDWPQDARSMFVLYEKLVDKKSVYFMITNLTKVDTSNDLM